MYGQPSLRKTNAGWDREAFIAGARYRALNSEARSRELGAFVCGVGDKSSMLNLKSDATTTGYNWGSLHTEQNLSKKFITLKTIGKSMTEVMTEAIQTRRNYYTFRDCQKR